MTLFLTRDNGGDPTRTVRLDDTDAVALSYVLNALSESASCPPAIEHVYAAVDELGYGAETVDDATERLCQRLDWLGQVPS